MLPVCISYSIYKGLSDPPLCSNCYRKWKLGTCWSHFLRASREKNASEHYRIQTTNQYSSYQYHYALKKNPQNQLYWKCHQRTLNVLSGFLSKLKINFCYITTYWIFSLFSRFPLLIKTAGIVQMISPNLFKCFYMPCWIQRQSPTL